VTNIAYNEIGKRLLKKLTKNHRQIYDSLVTAITQNNVLGFSQLHLRHNDEWWTHHGEPHVLGVISQMDEMIKGKAYKELNSIEALILLCSAWLHDIGYLKDKDREGKKLSDKEIRERHSELSRDLIIDKHIMFGIGDPMIAELIAGVCYCHPKRVDINFYFRNEMEFIDVLRVRVRLLAAILRLADATDVSSKRAPEILLKNIIDLPELSKRYWKACQLTQGIDYNLPKLEIIVDAKYKDEEEYRISLWKFKDLYKEYVSIRDILIKNNLNYADLIERLTHIFTRRVTYINAREYFKLIKPTSWEELQRRAIKRTGVTLGQLKEEYYDPYLYHERSNIEEEFDKFLESDKIGFAIVADAGYGKTNLFCHLAEKYRKNNIVLLYNGTYLQGYSNIENIIFNDLGLLPLEYMKTIMDDRFLCHIEFEDAIRDICELAGINSKIIVFLDAINEHDDPMILLRNINEMIRRVNSPCIKVALNCRSVIWNWFFDIGKTGVYTTRFYSVKNKPVARLKEFTDDELEGAYNLYRKHYNLKTKYKDLSKRTKNTCRNPLILKMISIVYEHQEIPSHVPLGTVFDDYYMKKIHPDLRDFLDDLVVEMINRQTDRPTRRQLRENPKLAKHIEDLSLDSSYIGLKNEGIIYEYGISNEVRFTFDKFFEYLIARELFPWDTKHKIDEYVSMIEKGKQFRPFWGAVKISLMLSKDNWDIFETLATVDEYMIRRILIDILTTLADQYRSRVESLLKTLLKSENVTAKRLVVITCYEMTPCPTKLFVDAILDKDEAVSNIATQYAYLVWTRSHRDGEKIVNALAQKGLKRLLIKQTDAFQASLELQEMIFLNHHKEKGVIELIDNHGLKRIKWIERFGSIFWVPEKVKIKILKHMIYSKWDVERETWLVPIFTCSEDERKAIRLIASYLQTDRYLDSDMIEMLYEWTGSKLLFTQGVIKCVLVVHGRLYPEILLPLIDRLLTSDNNSRKLIGIESLAFISKEAPQAQKLYKKVEDIIYFDPRSRMIAALGQNICASENRIDQPIGVIASIIHRAREERKSEVLKEVVAGLGDIGIKYPNRSLYTLEEVFNIKDSSVHEMLLQSLAKIRLLHPDILERYILSIDPENRTGLLEEVTSQAYEIASPYMRFFGVVDFSFDMMKIPQFQPLIIELFQMLSEVRGEEDLTRFIIEGYQKTLQVYMDRKWIDILQNL